MSTLTAGQPPAPIRFSDRLLLAREHCTPACFGYHASWYLFRRLGLKANPRWNLRFYRAAIEAAGWADRGQLRVLICGAADEAMLDTLARLFGPQRLRVHLVDRCATPLQLTTRYANRHDIPLSTEHGDVTTMDAAPGRYDLIVTDGLLSLLPSKDDRDRLLARLAASLTTAGRMLYTTRISGPGRPLEYDRLGRIVQAQTALTCWTGALPDRARLAADLMRRPARPSPFTTFDEVRDAFTPHFAHVEAKGDLRPPSRALRAHAWVHGHGSFRVAITAHAPEDR